MTLGRPKTPLILTDDERTKLQSWANRPTSAQRLALRARIILACAQGTDNKAVAKTLRITPHTVG
jgi:DNA-binding NarL/FixJ family response regulator